MADLGVHVGVICVFTMGGIRSLAEYSYAKSHNDRATFYARMNRGGGTYGQVE